jgi:hypothetical protein
MLYNQLKPTHILLHPFFLRHSMNWLEDTPEKPHLFHDCQDYPIRISPCKNETIKVLLGFVITRFIALYQKLL